MLRIYKRTPASLGFAMPPEWHPHRATWMSWPRPEGISFPDRYEPALSDLAAIIREIALRERVEINVTSRDYEAMASKRLGRFGCPLDNIFFHRIQTNECWSRDHGPAFVVRTRNGRRELAIVDWGFNAWGGKYPPYEADDAVPTRVAEEIKLPVFYPGIVMEGGAVDFNGGGTVMTTESCLLNKNRNPSLSREEIEFYLKEYYGQRHVVWLGQGIVGDDTDGHVDDLARFIGRRTVVVGVEEDPCDENFPILRENLKRLASSKDQKGRPFEIVELPMPGVVEQDGQRLPATYLNFYFVNGAILVPTFGHPNDRRALGILQKRLGPRLRVVGVSCREVIWGLGAIHCLTQQQPR